MSNQRDIVILEKIIEFCNDIEEINLSFGASLESLNQNKAYKHAVAMCVLQIGELTTHLTDAFKTAHNDVPWRDIRAMRNIAAHKYGTLDLIILHNTIQDRIPELRKYCEQIISQNQILEQDALTVQEPEMTM